MTPEESIKYLSSIHCNYKEEAQSVKIAIESLEKQIPKAPDYEGDGCDTDGNIIYDTWICPSCGERYEVDYDDYKYCPECGQAILHEGDDK